MSQATRVSSSPRAVCTGRSPTSQGVLSSRSLWDQHLPEPRGMPLRWNGRVASSMARSISRCCWSNASVAPERGGADVSGSARARTTSRCTKRATSSATSWRCSWRMLWLILSAAAWMQVELGLRPLRHVRNEVETLKRNPRERIAAAHVAEDRAARTARSTSLPTRARKI